jgi:hypothetical protein
VNFEEMGLDGDDPYIEARAAMRVMTARLTAATQTEPPHLVDVQVVNDQQVGIWHTIEPYNEMNDQSLQGWDVRRKRFVTFPWLKVVNLESNSRNYQRATEQEWQRRQLQTNLMWDEDKQIKQTVGVFWKGKRSKPRAPRRVII